MVGLWLIGLAWIAVFYVTASTGTDVPFMSDLHNWNLGIGFTAIILGVVLSTPLALTAGYPQAGDLPPRLSPGFPQDLSTGFAGRPRPGRTSGRRHAGRRPLRRG